MESRAFLKAFGLLPEALAGRLSRLLDRSNDRGRILDEERLIAHYRHYLAGLEGQADLAVFGHVHSPLDDPSCHPRLIVLGGWHRGTRYLRIDDQGATLRVVPDPDPSAVPA